RLRRGARHRVAGARLAPRAGRGQPAAPRGDRGPVGRPEEHDLREARPRRRLAFPRHGVGAGEGPPGDVHPPRAVDARPPARPRPAAGRSRGGMRRCFLAVAEVVEGGETAKRADVLLPAALWVEKEGVYGQGERRYQLVEKLLDPPGQARSDLAILVDLAE